MASRHRRERQPQPSLSRSARAKRTGRGWAASKGVRIPYAAPVGRSSNTVLNRPTDQCQAEDFCDAPRAYGTLWCARHCARAEKLGVTPPLP